MNQPVVSIIVPCYNYARFISQTLDSLIQQSFQEWECIIVDDGSKDNSKEVILPYTEKDNRFIYIYQDNKGLPGARNTGIKNARGTYIQFLDSDDLIEADKIGAQVKCFQENPELDLVYTDLMYFMDGSPEKLQYSMDWINAPWTLTKSGNGKDLLKYFIVTTPILVPMPLLKLSSVNSINGFKEHLRSCEDWDFWIRCAYNDFKFKYLKLKNTRSLVRIHPSSMTQNRTTMLQSMIEVRQLIDDMVENQKPLLQLNHKFLINNWIEMAIVKQQHESKQNAFEYLNKQQSSTSSIRMSLFNLTMRLLPPKLNLKLLAVIRSMMKKYYFNF